MIVKTQTQIGGFMISLSPTPEEKARGALSSQHLQTAVSALQNDGFVILRDIVDKEHIRVLRDRMLTDLQAILSRPDVPFNFTPGNLQQDPPPFHPFLFRDVLLNDLVIDITHAILGDGVKNIMYSGNTALQSELRQPVHPDIGQLWPNLQHATPPTMFVVNVPLVNTDARNGSTEFWPGTHKDTRYVIGGSLRVSEEHVEERRKLCPPFQATLECGDAVIRDVRMWHAGMPNHTSQPRPMIAMIHAAHWWHEGDGPEFPRETQAWFEHPKLATAARWLDGEINYLSRHRAFDLQK
jgi:hypothetical protein